MSNKEKLIRDLIAIGREFDSEDSRKWALEVIYIITQYPIETLD